MKVTGFEVFPVVCPPPFRGGRSWLFVRLDTDGGTHGYGEMMLLGMGFRLPVLAMMMADVIEQAVIGHDPYDTEMLFDKVYGRAGYSHYPELTKLGILSAIEMACWDIIGKEANQPVYNLLGGRVHERLRSYTYIYARPGDRSDVYQDPDLAAERAAEYLAQGFTALKFDPAGPYSAFDGRQLSLAALDLCERFMRQLRQAVGSQADLLFGTHGQMTAAGAIRLARRLERYDPLWFEEPVPPDAPEEMARVARATSIPIATGERLATKYDFARLLSAGGAAILQMNLGRVGGILEAKKIAALAEVHHAQLAPHLYCGPVVGAANIQLATCSPNFLILEGIERWQGFHADVLVKPIRWEAGYVIPPTEPGLGVELNEEFIARHPYRGKLLHLDMAGKPLG